MWPWSWNGWRGWCCRCASGANVSTASQLYHATGAVRTARPRAHARPTVPLRGPCGVWIVDLDQPRRGRRRVRAAPRRHRSARGRRRAATTRCATATSSRTVRCARSSARALGTRPGRGPVIDRRAGTAAIPRTASPRSSTRSSARLQPLALGVGRGDRGRAGRARASASTSRTIHPRARLDALAARARPGGGAPTGSTCPPRCSSRVPRDVDREGGVPQGDRRGLGASRCATCPSSPTAGRIASLAPSPRDAVVARRGRGRRPVVTRSRTWVPASGVAARRRMATTTTRRGPPRSAHRQVPRHRGRLGVRGGLLGLRDVARAREGREGRDRAGLSGAPPFTDPIVMRLDPDHPEDSIVMVRPWLRDPPAAPIRRRRRLSNRVRLRGVARARSSPGRACRAGE